MGRGLTGQVPSEERIQTVWEEARVGGRGEAILYSVYSVM